MFHTQLILRALLTILKNQEIAMATAQDLEAAIDNVTTQVAQVGTDVTAVLNLLTAAQQNGTAIPQDAIDKLTAISSSLTSIDGSLKGAEPPTA